MKTATTFAMLLTDEQRWQAVCERDPAYDGQFVFAVRTTGICCRPSCRSRRPLRGNVRFFVDVASALAAGFRPCKRCQPASIAPQQQRLRKVEIACDLLAQESAITLDALADAVGMSRWHFHRLFKTVTGLTPKRWQLAFRARRLRDALSASQKVTDAVLAAGFPDSSSYYRQADAALGMTARQYRDGGESATIYYTLSQCSLGRCLVAQSERGICAILLADSDEALLAELRHIFPRACCEPGSEAYAVEVEQVIRHLDNPATPFTLPLDLQGTAFQLQVWNALRAIPPGQTVSYQALAERIGRPAAVRAVASACAANKLAIVVPCHRVVRADGTRSGYRWGPARKAQLLMKESDKES